MTIVHTYRNVIGTERTALRFSICLNEKGYTTQIVQLTNGHRVIADDGRAVDFLK